MKIFLFLYLLFQLNASLLLKISNYNPLQTTISTQVQDDKSPNSYEDYMVEDDFNPILSLLLITVFLCIGLGIAITIVVLLIIFGLIITGILSASILIALNKKSFTKGFKVFIISTSGFCGFVVGLFVFYAIHEIRTIWLLSTALISGGILGVLAGTLFGYFIFIVIQKLTSFLKNKLQERSI